MNPERIDLDNGQHFTFTEGVTVRCLCGKMVRFGQAAQGSETSPIALHDMPPCDDYGALELLDYMKKVRENNERIIASGGNLNLEKP